MEESFKALDKLKNKIDIRMNAKDEEITFVDCKNLYKQYEQIILDIENHEPIDYTIYKMDEFNKRDRTKLTPVEQEELKRVKKQCRYNQWKKYIGLIIKYIGIPMLVFIISYIAIKLGGE